MMLAVLGNTPELSALELGAPYTGGQVAVLPTATPEIDRLGGTVKLATVIKYPIEECLPLLQAIATDHKLVFGFSVYAGDDSITSNQIKQRAQQLRDLGMQWKKQLKADGRSVRFVVSNEPALSSVIVTKEHLLRDQTDFVVAMYADKTIIARTVAVQDFKTFSDRDFGRPQRDSFSGMLPPKVARMMLNIATGYGQQPVETIHELSLLDPFCGSGTVIQEALSLGFKHVTGSDISKKCIEDTTDNIHWLIEQVPSINTDDLNLYQQDVLQLSNTLEAHSIDVVVAEGYLGPVQLSRLNEIMHQLNTFYSAMFDELAKIVTPHARLVLALPAWKDGEGLLELSLDQARQAAGFTAWHQPIVYGRSDARVVRNIIFLKRA